LPAGIELANYTKTAMFYDRLCVSGMDVLRPFVHATTIKRFGRTKSSFVFHLKSFIVVVIKGTSGKVKVLVV
jgi:hypothetical protein